MEDERLRFVARRLAGEAMTNLCREFGISPKTGHKICARYQATGISALVDRHVETAIYERRVGCNKV